MKFWNILALTLPAPATTTVSAKRQAPLVRVKSAKVISSDSTKGCLPGHFGVKSGTEDDTLTLIYGLHGTYLWPANLSDVRTAFCDYEVTLLFPRAARPAPSTPAPAAP
ncbi:hypothetical protein B0T26DRAFT_484373 [Lasiosphaeria miniovina]|uniref:Uncharacterized protein n=1 Tax=Lasiosphaeria miniovina TaxID=1954250 RepID=A0AA40A0V4_9PEZI|nr:uncharacterized protein B0T26DRAFT_484373 [Lasiosphaeria miniovina]KAK0707100.1 hypothetical protein B0T26DRAFT_484373 [Lasiosphaeria miniovina]